MSEGTAAVNASGHCLQEYPSRLRLVVLRKTLIDRIELLPFPRKLLAVVQTVDRLPLDQIGDSRERRKLAGMLSQPFIHDETRQILAMQVLAGRSLGLEEHGVVLDAEARPLADEQTLSAVMDAIPAAEERVHS
jgi:hypothetical protein